MQSGQGAGAKQENAGAEKLSVCPSLLISFDHSFERKNREAMNEFLIRKFIVGASFGDSG
jgi:hypothetical protein